MPNPKVIQVLERKKGFINPTLQQSLQTSFKHSYLNTVVLSYRILLQLKVKNGIPVKDLADYLNIPLRTAYYYISKLVRLGLVERRNSLLFITSRGVSVLSLLRGVCKLCWGKRVLSFEISQSLAHDYLEGRNKSLQSLTYDYLKGKNKVSQGESRKRVYRRYDWKNPIFYVRGHILIVYDVSAFKQIVDWFYGRGELPQIKVVEEVRDLVVREVSSFVRECVESVVRGNGRSLESRIKEFGEYLASQIVNKVIDVVVEYKGFGGVIHAELGVEREHESWVEASLRFDWKSIRHILKQIGYLFGRRKRYVRLYAKCEKGKGDVLKLEKCLHRDLIDLIYDLGVGVFEKDCILMTFVSALIMKYLGRPKSILQNVINLAYQFDLEVSYQYPLL